MTITANDVALAGVAVAGLSAIASALAPLIQGSRTRRHEERMARQSRLYPDVRKAYSDLLHALYPIQVVIDRSQAENGDPSVGFVALENNQRYQDGCRRAFADARSIASDPVNAAIDQVDLASKRFLAFARSEGHDELDRIRLYQDYLAELTTLEKLMRDELRA